jgi:hypothetical protein
MCSSAQPVINRSPIARPIASASSSSWRAWAASPPAQRRAPAAFSALARACVRLGRRQRQRAQGALPAFVVVPARVPERPQRRHQPQCRRRIRALHREIDRRAQIIVLQGQAFEPGDLVGREQMRLRLLGQLYEVGQVPLARHVQLICVCQPFVRVGPHRLQQPVARRIVPLVHDQERFIDQLREQFQN